MSFGPLVLVAACLVPAAALGQPTDGALPPAAARPASLASVQVFRFAGTHWGASSTETTGALAAHGFRLEQSAEQGDLIFSGVLNARPALVVALFAADGLTKILVSVPTEEASTIETYLDMKRALGGEYGSPEIDVETYAYPFANGKHVGYEIAALRVGKATIGAMWKTNGEALGLKITDRLIVSAHYESPAWKQEAERRVRRVGP